MNITTFLKCMPLQINSKKYEEFVRKIDYKRLLTEEPLCIKDEYYGDNKELIKTDLSCISGYIELHRNLDETYGLSEIAEFGNDYEKVLKILEWLTENTFYNGAQMHLLKDDTRGILKYAYGKNFRKAINCRWKAISFADCLVAVGIKAYPVAMCSAEFKNSHFICHAFIRELDKWCAFDPSFGCRFSDEKGKPIDAFEMREIFLQGREPVISGYNFNGTTECLDVYINGFLKLCLSNLSTWKDNSMERRNTKNLNKRKMFNGRIPDEF